MNDQVVQEPVRQAAPQDGKTHDGTFVQTPKDRAEDASPVEVKEAD